MSKLARDHRNTDLAKIHLAKKQLGMDDVAYREIIRAVGRAQTGSSKDLDHVGRKRVLEHFKSCGLGLAKTPPPQGWQAAKLEKLWVALGEVGALNDPSPAGLVNFVYARAGVSALKFLSTEKASTLTEALKAWLKRAKSKAKTAP